MSGIWKEPRSQTFGHVSSWTYHVRVCSFTFNFASLEHLQEYLEYFSKKTHPSGRGYKVGFCTYGDHDEHQTCFQRLPLYLSEEAKRQKVIKALQEALDEFSQPN